MRRTRDGWCYGLRITASGQKLPEVRLDMELETQEAGRVRALECDYEFITLEGTGELGD
ncbi:MAG: hypothetical protein LUK37_15985 [Clostridia bacterium]|nr:hypothetical protein [Clostridia bacterium]